MLDQMSILIKAIITQSNSNKSLFFINVCYLSICVFSCILLGLLT